MYILLWICWLRKRGKACCSEWTYDIFPAPDKKRMMPFPMFRQPEAASLRAQRWTIWLQKEVSEVRSILWLPGYGWSPLSWSWNNSPVWYRTKGGHSSLPDGKRILRHCMTGPSRSPCNLRQKKWSHRTGASDCHNQGTGMVRHVCRTPLNLSRDMLRESRSNRKHWISAHPATWCCKERRVPRWIISWWLRL